MIIPFCGLIIFVNPSFSQCVSSVQDHSPADAPSTGNCIPFGAGNNYGTYQGFVYKNIEAFELCQGDTIAFDLGAENDTSIQMDIWMATCSNGGDITTRNSNYQQIVSEVTPTDPNGDNVVGNFELKFVVNKNSFQFPGGGLIIRFSPTGPFIFDSTCTAVLSHTDNTDGSNEFVQRWWNDETTSTTDRIGGFQIIPGCGQLQADFNYTPDCDTTAIHFQDASESFSSIKNWKWKFGSSDSTMMQNPTDTFPSSGTESVKLTVTELRGCQSTITKSIQVPAPPSHTTGATAARSGYNDGKAWVNVSGGTKPYNYHWFDPANQITDTAYNLSAGKYTVIVNDKSNCRDTLQVRVPLMSGTAQLAQDEDFGLYPNPAPENLHIIIPSHTQATTLTLTNVVGQQVYQQSVPEVRDQVSINVEPYKAGLYLLRLQTEEKTYQQKVMIAN